MWRRLLSFQLAPHTGFFLKPSTSLFYDFQSFFFFFAVIAVFCGTFGGTAGRRGTSKTGHQIIDENSKQIICVQQVLAPLPRENTSLAAVTVFLSNMKPVFFHFRHNDGTVRITRTYIYGHVRPLGCLAFFFFFFGGCLFFASPVATPERQELESVLVSVGSWTRRYSAITAE